MKKVKIMSSDNYNYLSQMNEAINEFIKNKTLIDIQFQVSSRKHKTVYAVMIIYEE